MSSALRPSVATATVEEAAASIRSGDVVVLGALSAEPAGLVAAICDRASELEGVTFVGGVMLDGYPFLDHPREAFGFRTWFMPSALLGRSLDPTRLEYLPLSWAQVVRMLANQPIDVVLVQVAPPGPDGMCSLGTSVSYTSVALERAERAIAVVNPRMPYTFGDSEVPISRFDVVVESDELLPTFPERPADEVDREMATAVAATIGDGSCLQVGVGTLPAAVVSALASLGRRDLQQLSMLTDSYLELVSSGACSTTRPSGLVGEVVGSTELYEHVHRNPSIVMADGRRTHGLEHLVGTEQLVVLGSALEVDLFGQANLELLGGAQAGSVGGAIDFLSATAASSSAQSVLMLRAETRSGRSRIVPRISGPVSVGRTFTRRVVTEHGEAALDGLSARERALVIAEIAAPEHRDELRRYVHDNPGAFCG